MKARKMLHLLRHQGAFFKNSMSLAECQNNPIDVNFYLQKSLEIFVKNSAHKFWSKKESGWKVPSPMPIGVMSRKQRASRSMDFSEQETSRKLIFIKWNQVVFFNFHIFAKLSETCFMNAKDDFDCKRTHFYNFLNANSFLTKAPQAGHSEQQQHGTWSWKFQIGFWQCNLRIWKKFDVNTGGKI